MCYTIREIEVQKLGPWAGEQSMTFGLVLLQDEMEHQSQSLEKDKIKSLSTANVGHKHVGKRSKQQSRSPTLRQIYILTQQFSFPLSSLYLNAKAHTQTHTQLSLDLAAPYLFVPCVFLGSDFWFFSQSMKHSCFFFFFNLDSIIQSKKQFLTCRHSFIFVLNVQYLPFSETKGKGEKRPRSLENCGAKQICM